MTEAEPQRWTAPADIANALFWANVDHRPLCVELERGGRFLRARVRKLTSDGKVAHFGTRFTTHAIVPVVTIVAVTT